jgi:hypothetical protein
MHERTRPGDGAGIVRTPWRKHLQSVRWEQGDHILLAAPTRAGKTTMARKLIEKRGHTVVFVTKTHDSTIKNDYRGFYIARSWRDIVSQPWHEKVLLWPKAEKTLMATARKQRDIFGEALDRIGRGNRDGWSGWCCVVDESHYMTDPRYLNLGKEIAMLHHVGRSAGISMVDLTQRPSWIPKIVYSSVTHAWIARTRDMDDLKRLSDLGGIDPRQLRDSIVALPSRHDYVYVNPQGDARPVIVNTRK